MNDDEITKLFCMIDKDKNGYITRRELSKFFKAHECKFNSREVKAYIKSVDQNGDGKISLDELKQALRGKCG
ncbi:unnamed protein product [Calicophoron daubneyi]|uniref:EF-hand domain-containing protein n=1 Tax=Calicophoron daubneyi TaxID=300641 RepID=A0AAV2TSL4_CALDB